MSTATQACHVCPMVGPHGHDKELNPVLVGSRVMAHGEVGVVEKLNKCNASVRYDDRRHALYVVSYSMLKVLDVEDSRPTAVAAGKLHDAWMLIEEARRLLPESDCHFVELRRHAARLHSIICSIEESQ